MTGDEEVITGFVREALGTGSKFEPFAAYDPDLERIIVLTRDCSFTEISVGSLLTMFQDNHPGEGETELVGFAIECAKPFANYRFLLNEENEVELNRLLEAILERDPQLKKQVAAAKQFLEQLPSAKISLN